MAADVWAYAYDEDYPDIPFLSLGPPATPDAKDRPPTKPATALHFAVALGDVNLVRRLLKNQVQASTAVTSVTGTPRGVFADNASLPEFVPRVANDCEPYPSARSDASGGGGIGSGGGGGGGGGGGSAMSVAAFLCQSPVRFLSPTRSGYTALHLAVLNNEVACCEAILEHLHQLNLVEAFINQRAGRLQKTPLMYAAGIVSGNPGGNHSCVPVLLKYGATRDLKDAKHRTALDHASAAEDRVKDTTFGGDVLRGNASKTVLLLTPPPISSLRRKPSDGPPSAKRINHRKTPPGAAST